MAAALVDKAGPSRAGCSMMPPPAKRIKIEAISVIGNASASAVDLDSDDVPDQLKCPICEEVYLGEVIQCPKGHPICKECLLNSGKPDCSQCRTPMKSAVNGEWIRVRMVEELLDAMLFTCPFHKNGCGETLSRGQVRGHKESCRFDPDRAQICKYFKNGKACDYWSRTDRPEEALEHLKNAHHLDMLYPEGHTKFWFDLEGPLENVKAVAIKQNGATYLTIAWTDKTVDNISFACIRLDKPTPGQRAASKAELTLERQKPRPRFKVPNWKLTLPIVSLWEAPSVLEHKPTCVSRPFLKKYLLKNRVQDAQLDEDSSSTSSEEDDEEDVQANVLVSIF